MNPHRRDERGKEPSETFPVPLGSPLSFCFPSARDTIRTPLHGCTLTHLRAGPEPRRGDRRYAAGERVATPPTRGTARPAAYTQLVTHGQLLTRCSRSPLLNACSHALTSLHGHTWPVEHVFVSSSLSQVSSSWPGAAAWVVIVFVLCIRTLSAEHVPAYPVVTRPFVAR